VCWCYTSTCLGLCVSIKLCRLSHDTTPSVCIFFLMNMYKHAHTNFLTCTLPPARTNTHTYTRQTIDRNGNMACLFTDHQKALSKSIDSNGNFVSTSLNCPGRSSEVAVPANLVCVDDARLSLAPGVCRGDLVVDECGGDFSASPTVVTSSGEESMVPC